MNKLSPTLFYSWQSDDPKTRNYIEKSLKKALANVAKDMNVEDAPRLDKDTLGEVGAVSISATIKRKINESKIFAADVSLIDAGKKGKKLTNQNVMFELGYAFGKKTEQAVMMIANSDLGDASELPFDIAQNRIIFCSPSKDPKGEKLIPVLEYAIRSHLDLVNEAFQGNSHIDMKEQLIDAIENSKPTTTKAENFFESIFQRYKEIAPAVSKGGEPYETYGERMVDGYQQTLPLVTEVYEVVSTAAEYDNLKTVEVCYKMLGIIAARFDQHSADEFAALVIQEIASIILGCLAKFGRWTEINKIINTQFTPTSGGSGKYKIENTYQYPEGVKQYYNAKTGTNYAIPTTPLIQNRFVDNDKILKAYVSGSLLLMFALEFYYPYVAGLLLQQDNSYVPDYIQDLQSYTGAKNFSHSLGMSTGTLDAFDKLVKRVEEKMKQPLCDGLAYWNRDLEHIFKEADLLPLNEKVGKND